MGEAAAVTAVQRWFVLVLPDPVSNRFSDEEAKVPSAQPVRHSQEPGGHGVLRGLPQATSALPLPPPPCTTSDLTLPLPRTLPLPTPGVRLQ